MGEDRPITRAKSRAIALQSESMRWITVALLLLFFWLAMASMVDDSPTMDEQNHIARGYAFLKTADPRLSMEHPPLINAWAAVPLLALPDLQLPTDDPSWQREPIGWFWYDFADAFFWERNNVEAVSQMVVLARIPMILLTMGLGVLGLHIARSLWGKWAGVIGLGLILFDPTVMAHGRYATTDVGGSMMLLLASWLLWRLWHGGSLVWAAVGLGLAFASKLSNLGFVPIWGVMAILPLYLSQEETQQRHGGRRLARYLAAGVLSIGVVWAIFGFEWGAFLFLDERLHWLNQWQGPMPTFWAGVERIMFKTGGGEPAFLNGAYAADGFRTYFPIALWAKTVPTTLLAFVVAAGWLLVKRPTRHKALFWLLPAVAYFALAVQGGLNIGYRHLMPILPMLYICVAGLTTCGWLGRLLATLTLLGTIVSSLLIHPHYLSYFSPVVGGASNGWQILIDSNVDWGQDLYRLRDWMAENEVERVNLGWFGSSRPHHFIDYDPLPGGSADFLGLWFDPPFDPQQPEPGIYAISVHNLQEMPIRYYDAFETSSVYGYFRQREPDVRIGYSINIYFVEG